MKIKVSIEKCIKDYPCKNMILLFQSIPTNPLDNNAKEQYRQLQRVYLV